jgi:exodeoxyribonuclease VII large subunit
LRERFDSLAARGKRAFETTKETRASRFAAVGKLLEAFSYHSVLARGFALVRDAAGKPVRLATAVSPNDALEIEFADGRVPAVATAGSAKRPRGGPKSGGQGSLFG